MSILGDLNNAVGPSLLRGIRMQGLSGMSRTAMILKARAEIKSGAAGNGIEIIQETEQADGQHYRGFDPIEARTTQEGTIGHFARWTNFLSDAAIAGTDMEENLGLTISQIIDNKYNYSQLGIRGGRSFFSIAKQRYRQVITRIRNQASCDVWGAQVPGSVRRRLPENLTHLFDETADWHGLGPGGLGTWDEALQPWGEDPPNTLNTDAKYYRHIPQVFSHIASGETSYTPGVESGAADLYRASKRAFDEPGNHMDAAIPGIWICPLHPTRMTEMAQDFEGFDQGPLLVGHKGWQLGIRCINYGQAWYYADARASKDWAWHIHVGEEGMDEDASLESGFRMCCWMPENHMEEYNAIREFMMEPPDVPYSGLGITLGMDMSLPLYNDGWRPNMEQADAAVDRVRMKYTYVGANRWKNYKVKLGTKQPERTYVQVTRDIT